MASDLTVVEPPEQPAVLLVDDLQEKLLVLQTVLEGLPCELVTAHSGREALSQVLRRRFAVVLLDVNMPDIDGLETAAMIRGYGPSAQTPIIFVTAYVDEMQAAQGYSLGAVDYILSPVVPEVLRSKVRVFLDLDEAGRRAKALAAAEAVSRRLAFVAHASRLIGGSLQRADPPTPLLDFLQGQFGGLAVAALVNGGSVAFHASGGATGSSLPAGLRAALEKVLGGAERVELEAGSVLPLRFAGRTMGALLVTGNGAQEAWQALEDIADRLAAALENARLYRELQSEIDVRRAAELELQEASRRKDEFLAMLSHELRNPLAPIRSAAELVRQLAATHAGLERAAGIIARQVDHMRRLIDELLDVARISQGKIVLDLQSLDLRAVLAQATETVRPLIEARGHTLVTSQPEQGVWLRGDAARLTQVVSNLLTNAAKYTPPDGRIELTLAAVGGEARLTVRDNGIGIDATLLPRVFDLFEQGERGLDRAQGGLGVGLTLAQRLVMLHQGSIVAASAGPGGGAEFVVRLPCLAEVQPPAVSRQAPAPAPAGRCRVLVVDDNEDAAESVAALLELAGHEVCVARDGATALATAESQSPGVVVLDLGLPGMDGFEVARRLREAPAGSAAMLIALTGYGSERDRDRVREAGFDLHLIKPADPLAILRAIEQRPGDVAVSQ
jgi:signal transduction histidine kinase